MMKAHKQKVIAAFKVAHGIYYQARFIIDGQPICVQFQKSMNMKSRHSSSAKKVYAMWKRCCCV